MKQQFTAQNISQNNIGKTLVFAVFILMCGFFILQSVTLSHAQSRKQVCNRLNIQLSNLGRTSRNAGNPAKYRRYDQAIRQQEIQLSKAKRALRRNACLGIRNTTSRQCRAINTSLGKMRKNLAKLKQQRKRYAPHQVDSSRKRRQINAALRENRCGEEHSNPSRHASNQPQKKKSRRRTLLEQIFGVRTYSDRGSRDDRYDTGINSSLNFGHGTYRTLCVRKSDGYYFPISFSTVPERFDYDEEVCRNMCPSSKVALYIHRMPNEDSEDMVSYRTEIPYIQESFAFAYRKAHNPDLKCRFSVAGIHQGVDNPPTGTIEATNGSTTFTAIPAPRQDATTAPDVIDNQLTGFNMAQAIDYANSLNSVVSEKTSPVEQKHRKIRIVGPAFFPVQ